MPATLRSVIDIEASGFGRASYPIEVGYVRDDGSTWCSLIQPDGDWTHWDPGAEGVHGIARSSLQAHGRPALWVASQLNQALAGHTVYCDGWAHDYTWLARLFDSAGLVPRFHLESVNRLLDEQRLARLDSLRRGAYTSLGIARHRASSDAKALQWALAQLEAS